MKQDNVAKTTDKKAHTEEMLQNQSEALKRLINADDRPVTEIAKLIDVDRQSIYLWMRGKVAIPESKLIALSKLFGREPAEIRYDITLFNRDDLCFVATQFENELARRQLSLPAEKKAFVLAQLYNEYQTMKRRLSNKLAHDGFIDRLVGALDMISS